MTIWRYVRTSLGDTGIAVVVLVTLATALVAGLIAPRLIPASDRAEARVSITQVTGSRASWALMRSKSSRPDRSGSFTSRMIASGLSFTTSASPARTARSASSSCA